MPTNLAIDDKLLNKARKIGQFKTKRETVNRALQEYVNRHKQMEMLELFGKMDPDSDYDYKKSRNR